MSAQRKYGFLNLKEITMTSLETIDNATECGFVCLFPVNIRKGKQLVIL